HWFRELNLDPRHRVAAGLGTLVVRYEQEQLMASAWDQLAKQEQDNQRLKRAQLAEAVGDALLQKHVAPLAPAQLLQVTGPAHGAIDRIAARGTLTTPPPPFPLGSPVLSGAFRRLSRPRGPLARRLDHIRSHSFGGYATAALAVQGMDSATTLAALAITTRRPRGQPMSNLQAMKSYVLTQLDPARA